MLTLHLDTLAQIGTREFKKPPIELTGLGSDIKEKSVLTSRAKRKMVTQKVVKELIAIARKKEDKEFEKALWNTFYCMNKVVVSDQKLYGNYYKNRICTVCNSIRKAQIINKYLPIIQQWEKPYLVTLTAKSCYGKDLNSRMRSMKRAFRKILAKCKKITSVVRD